MTKAQLAAALLAGATVGGGGVQLAGTLLAKANPAPFVHAVDMRQTYGTDAGIRFYVYAGQPQPDGGVKDIGQPAACLVKPATLKKADDVMRALANECSWEQ